MKKIKEKLEYWAWLVLYRFGRRYKGWRAEERIEAHKYALRDHCWRAHKFNREIEEGRKP